MFRTLFSCSIAAAALLANSVSAVTTTFTGYSWLQVNPSPHPSWRGWMAYAYDPVSARVVIFGGEGVADWLDETWVYDGSTWSQIQSPTHPIARGGSALAFDTVTQKLVLFGGFHGAQQLGDTWLFDGATSTWTQAQPSVSPPPCSEHVMFTDPLDGHVELFGGVGPAGDQSGTWRWDGTTWLELNPAHSPPTPREYALAVLDPQRGYVVLYGGLGSATNDDTWLWDGKDWSRRAPATHPPRRVQPCAAFDAALGNVVIYGGASGFGFNDVALHDMWEWTGEDWRPIRNLRTPDQYVGCALAYHEAIGRLVLFGGSSAPPGNGPGVLDTTWWFVTHP